MDKVFVFSGNCHIGNLLDRASDVAMAQEVELKARLLCRFTAMQGVRSVGKGFTSLADLREEAAGFRMPNGNWVLVMSKHHVNCKFGEFYRNSLLKGQTYGMARNVLVLCHTAGSFHPPLVLEGTRTFVEGKLREADLPHYGEWFSLVTPQLTELVHEHI